MKPIIHTSRVDGAKFPMVFTLFSDKVDPSNRPSGLYLSGHSVGEYGTGGTLWVFQPKESFVFVQNQ